MAGLYVRQTRLNPLSERPMSERPVMRDDENWLKVIRVILDYVRPSNIIELLLLSEWGTRTQWDVSSIDRPAYLRHLGVLDAREGIIADEEFGHQSRVCYLTMLEDHVDAELNEFVSQELEAQGAAELDEKSWRRVMREAGTRVTKSWLGYRYGSWTLDSRARVFFRDEEGPQEIRHRTMHVLRKPGMGLELSHQLYTPYFRSRVEFCRSVELDLERSEA
ncbi:hypothetical protein BO71DRAFT_433010 [Aspergillus ellipticus CBS 707.79]|uniref:Uncharacterized protein n=1 Tax=Aspergillus ellipticus CBS 707.79 TaxID=1448320 RepID=A0A319DAD5_9EURO|nr:hypothetical protein BO71DRAFT_433010 [Aspergillus ellipticus CBS 707.79]